MKTSPLPGGQLRGGGTLPIPSGQLNLTWPFVLVDVGTSGVTLRARLRWLTRRAAALGGSEKPAELTWSHAWHELDKALIAPRKVVLIPRDGRGCRFVTIRRRHLSPLLAALAEHDVRTEKISRFSRAGFSL